MTAVTTLWHEYKHTPVQCEQSSSSPSTAIHNEWSLSEDDSEVDQFAAYLAEPWALISADQSPIPYWISKTTVWPQLARMALDIYSTPVCSDEPERIFSSTGDLLQPRRHQMTADHVEEIQCLRSWQSTSIVTLDAALFDQAMRQGDEESNDDEIDANNTTESNDEVLYHEHE